METTLARNLDNLLLSESEVQDMRANVHIRVHDFKGLAEDQRLAKFSDVKEAWSQFADICQGEVDAAHISKFAAAIKGRPESEDMHTDYVVVISVSRHVLGYALVSEDAVEHVGVDRNNYNHNKALGIKLLCARKASGIGTQLVRVCENLARHLKCASIHLEAVPTAYGFYKKMGLDPFRRAKDACSPGYTDADAQKFEVAIRAMAQSFRPASDGRVSINPEASYDRFMGGKKTTEAQRAVLSGILSSKIVPRADVWNWTAGVHRIWLIAELNKIAHAFFVNTKNTVPMSKCLLTPTEADKNHGRTSPTTTASEPQCVVLAASGDVLHCDVYMSDTD